MTASHIIAQHAELRAATMRLWEALRDRVNGACEWVDSHPAGDHLLQQLPDPDQAVTGGEGTPCVDPASVAEFAALLGKPTGAGFRIIGEALELRHRLPRLWRRMQALEISAEDACRVAARTMTLDRAAADWVDAHIAHFAGSVSVSQLDRTVEAAKAMTGAPVDDDSTLFVHLEHDTTGVNGHTQLRGELSLADGLELDSALRHGAELQKSWGSTASLGARRAHALGELARRQSLLPAPQTESDVTAGSTATDGPTPGTGPGPRPPAPRLITLNLTLPAAAIGGPTTDPHALAGSAPGQTTPGQSIPDQTTLGRLDNLGASVTAEQIRRWCGVPGATITVRPVIDLTAAESTDCYTPTRRIRAHVQLTHPTCVFPFCTLPSGSADLDHIRAFEAGGPTTTDNLAPLCRRHHRLKTHHGWHYRRLGARRFRWSSPEGEIYLRDGQQTHQLGRSLRRLVTGRPRDTGPPRPDAVARRSPALGSDPPCSRPDRAAAPPEPD